MNPVVEATTDRSGREISITTHFRCSAADVWSLFADREQLLQWWGPPNVPMTIDHHDMRSDGRVELTVYFPDGERITGRWTIVEADPPRLLHFRFESDGIEATTIVVSIEPAPTGTTTMTLTAHFDSPEHYDHAINIGFDQGLANSVDRAHSVLKPAA